MRLVARTDDTVTKIFMRFTLSAFGRIAFDHRFDSLPPSAEGLEAPDAFAEALDTVQQAANRRLYNPLWRLSEKVVLPNKLIICMLNVFGASGQKDGPASREEPKDDPFGGLRPH